MTRFDFFFPFFYCIARNKRKADDNVSNDSSMKKRTTVESKAVDQGNKKKKVN